MRTRIYIGFTIYSFTVSSLCIKRKLLLVLSVKPVEYIWLNSPLGRGFSERNTLGKGVSQGNLNLSLIRAFCVSLPPFEEQLRIVKQVETLVVLCDLLKVRLKGSQNTQLHLTDAIVEQAI